MVSIVWTSIDLYNIYAQNRISPYRVYTFPSDILRSNIIYFPYVYEYTCKEEEITCGMTKSVEVALLQTSLLI